MPTSPQPSPNALQSYLTASTTVSAGDARTGRAPRTLLAQYTRMPGGARHVAVRVLAVDLEAAAVGPARTGALTAICHHSAQSRAPDRLA